MKKNNPGEYHNLYVQSDTLLLADVFETFQNKCIEIYELDPTCLLSVPWLAWQAYFKKAEVELELLTHIDMLLMVEKGIRGGISHAIKTMNHHMLCIYMQIVYMGIVSKITSLKFSMLKFNEKLVQIYDEYSEKDTFLKQMLNTLKGFIIITMIYHFYQKKLKLKNETSLYAICMTKTITLHTSKLWNKH